MRFISPVRALLVAATVANVALAAHASAPDLATQKKIAAMSVPFVPNAGQWNERAAFAAQTFAGTVFVTKQGELVYSLPGKPLGAETESVGTDSAALGSHKATPSRRLSKASERSPGWALTETLVDSKGRARPMRESTLKAPAGYRPMEGKVGYAVGHDTAKHINSLNTYERVNLGDMYPGINVQLRATGNNVEKIFTVAPQQDPKQINIAVTGADKLEIGDSGELIALTGNGPVTFTAPIAFQENAAGERVAVAVSYALNANGQRYGFTLGEYDRTQALVIDPLLQSTYFGGSTFDAATAIAIHPATGEVYIAGDTTSTDLPGSAGGAQTEFVEALDGFVVRFNSTLTSRLQTTYFGGDGTDGIYALAIHPTSGDVYVAGSTTSSNLPERIGGAQFAISLGKDGFVARINAGLTAVVQSTYFGGTGSEVAYALAIHPNSGEVYIAGVTASANLPGTSGGAQSFKSTGDDAFVARFNAALTTRLQSTYLGGTSHETAYALAIHPASGEVYLAGSTSSVDLPGTVGGAQSAASSGGDAFIARLNAALTVNLHSTYLGGTDTDGIYALAIHPASGEVYVAGETASTDFPGVMGGSQPAKAVNKDAFVTRLNAALTARLQSTYLGGASNDGAYALTIHPSTGEVYVVGYTGSGDLPGTAGAAQISGGSMEAFVTRFSASLTMRLQSSFLGGSGWDMGYGVAIHPNSGDIYVVGETGNLPSTAGGAQSVYAGGQDGFVSALSADLTLNDTTPNPFAFVVQTKVPLLSARTSNPTLITGIVGFAGIYVDGTPSSQYCVSSASNCLCDVSTAFVSAPGTITNNSYVCVRHTSAPVAGQIVRSDLHVGGAAAPFISATGGVITACSLDIDGSGGVPNAASDGLMLVRAMLGFTGTAVTGGAIVGAPPRNTWTLIRTYLNDNCGTNFAP